jgi:hypothetical protein
MHAPEWWICLGDEGVLLLKLEPEAG